MRMEENIVFPVIHGSNLGDHCWKRKQQGQYRVCRKYFPHIVYEKCHQEKNGPKNISRKKCRGNYILLRKDLCQHQVETEHHEIPPDKSDEYFYQPEPGRFCKIFFICRHND